MQIVSSCCIADCHLVGVPPVLTLEGVEGHVLNCDSPKAGPFNCQPFPKSMPFLKIHNPYIDLLHRNDERVKLWGFLLRNTCISVASAGERRADVNADAKCKVCHMGGDCELMCGQSIKV